MVICVLGSIVLIADRAFVTPSEHSVPGTATLVMPSMATPSSPDGRFDAHAPRPAFAGNGGAERAAVASEVRLYPEPAADAVRDETGIRRRSEPGTPPASRELLTGMSRADAGHTPRSSRRLPSNTSQLCDP